MTNPPQDRLNNWEEEFDEKFPYISFRVPCSFTTGGTIMQRDEGDIKLFIHQLLSDHDKSLREKVEKMIKTEQYDEGDYTEGKVSAYEDVLSLLQDNQTNK